MHEIQLKRYNFITVYRVIFTLCLFRPSISPHLEFAQTEFEINTLSN